MNMFKEYIANDLQNIFMNADEHGEAAVINGVSVTIIPDSDKLEYNLKKDTEGLITGDILFFISDTEYSKIPKISSKPTTFEALLFNGKPAVITAVSGDLGLYVITLQFTGGR